jgi:hypothetical protein
MALNDLVLTAKINMELIRDPRVSALHTHVLVDHGVVTLTGDNETEAQCQAAVEIARRVPGVLEVRNQLTCGVARQADTVELLKLSLLEKLNDTWNNLPDQTARTQAEYLRWALWLAHKFRIPARVNCENREQQEAEAVEAALANIAAALQMPKALVYLEMQREVGSETSAPHITSSAEK